MFGIYLFVHCTICFHSWVHCWSLEKQPKWKPQHNTTQNSYLFTMANQFAQLITVEIFGSNTKPWRMSFSKLQSFLSFPQISLSWGEMFYQSFMVVLWLHTTPCLFFIKLPKYANLQVLIHLYIQKLRVCFTETNGKARDY